MTLNSLNSTFLPKVTLVKGILNKGNDFGLIPSWDKHFNAGGLFSKGGSPVIRGAITCYGYRRSKDHWIVNPRGDVCFGFLGVNFEVVKGEEIGASFNRERIGQRYTLNNIEEDFGFPLYKLHEWWFSELESMGQHFEYLTASGLSELLGEKLLRPPLDQECIFPFLVIRQTTEVRWTQILGRLTLIDLVQRGPAVLWLYKKLRDRLPNENRYFLLQIAHFVPYNCLNIGLYQVPNDTVAHVVNYSLYNDAHMCGTLEGAFDLTPSLEHSVAQTSSPGATLNRGWFKGPNGFGTLNPEWTLNEFAEFAEKYIKDQRRLLGA